MSNVSGPLRDALLRVGAERLEKIASGELRYADDPAADELLHTDPYALLLGLLAQQWRTRPGEVWEVPWRLRRCRGHLDVARLVAEPAAVRRCFASGAICRTHRDRMAEIAIRSAALVLDQYGGDAARVWSDTADPFEIARRFRGFYGVGPKIAAMAPIILRQGFKVSVDPGGDIAVDANVRRVFVRSALSRSEDGDAGVRAAAARLNPGDPGGLDLGSWVVGADWCKRRHPRCPDCPLREAGCARLLA